MKRVLVVGGAGYIGSHVSKALFQKGYEPITLDNLSLGHESAVRWGPFVYGDCGDQDLVARLIDEKPIVGVIHLAARSNVRESCDSPVDYFQSNVSETLSLLNVLTRYHVSHFVFSSTCAVYGRPQSVPMDESHPLSPISPYGTSKWMVEKALESLSQSSGLKVAILRYFNAAGADPDGETGEAHDPETHLIPLLIQTALKQRSHFTLFGDSHDTEDGTPIRDYIHVTDLAEAHVLALQHLIETEESTTLNLGTGRGYSIREIILEIEETYGVAIPLTVAPPSPMDPPILVANPACAKETLGWLPRCSDIKTIIETAWNWHQNPVAL